MNEIKLATKLPSKFRLFLSEMWMQHKDEILVWEKRLPEYDSTYYFRKHRWLLKEMFKLEIKNNKE